MRAIIIGICCGLLALPPASAQFPVEVGVLSPFTAAGASGPSYVQKATCEAAASSTITCTLGSALGSGHEAHWAIAYNFNNFPTNWKFNGTTMVDDESAGNVYVETYSLKNITTGGTAATATCGGSACMGMLYEVAPASVTGTVDQTALSNTTGTTWNTHATATLAQAVDVAIGAAMYTSNQSTWAATSAPFTGGSATCNTYNSSIDSNYSIFMCFAPTTSTTGITFSGTAGTGAGSSVVAAFK